MKKIAKTFYSVRYAIWGADSKSTAWFDDKRAADKFSCHDFRDDPVRHTVSKPDTISLLDEACRETEYNLSFA